MKRSYLIALLGTFVLFSSFRCSTVAWSFSVLLQFQDENQNLIEDLDVSFDPPLALDNRVVTFDKENEYSSNNVITFKGYDAFFFICPVRDLPPNTTYLEWDRLKSILDGTIKVFDPNNKYKKYTTTLRELIEENSEYKNRKVDDLYNGTDDPYNLRLTFKIPLEKKQNAGEVSTK